VHPETLLSLGRDLRTKTEVDGKFAIDGIPPTSVALWFVSPRHRTGRADLAFSRAGEILEADVSLADANTLSGRVTDESGLPLEGATVQAWNELGSLSKTDASGRFVIQRLGDGPVQLSAHKKGYGTVYVRDIAPNRNDLSIRLPKAGTILGRIDAESSLAECEVKLWRYDEHHRREIMVRGAKMPLRSSRTFRLEELSPGSYTLTAEAPGYALESPVSVAVESGGLSQAAPLRLRKK